ncbi:MAG: sterol desaturase family protein [Vicinamibacterales bacterium]
MLVAAFVCAGLALALRRRKTLGLAGLGLALAAVWLGGSRVPVDAVERASVWLGVDWFLLNMLLTAAVFVPIERAFALRPGQRVFRPAWTVDLAWFLWSHLVVQVLSFLIVAPASVVSAAMAVPQLQDLLRALPLVLQIPLAVLVADLVQYGVHRLSHEWPLLWRFHRVHHSTTTMDWLAGSRLHLVDVVLTRGAVLCALLLMGFEPLAMGAYVGIVAVQAVFVHANFAPRARWLERVIVLPRFHHWHHAAHDEAVNCNFAVHLPWLDRWFGSHHLPRDAWPERYGLIGETGPEGFLAQLAWPFRRAHGSE